MSLSNTTCKNIKPLDKPFKLHDEKGLYLFVHPNGGKYFRFDYRFNQKRKTLALGIYPDVSLKQAREKRDEARSLLAQNIDPCIHKKAIKQTQLTNTVCNSFELIANEWYAQTMLDKSASHQKRTLNLLQRDLLPYLNNKAISDIKPMDLLAVLRRIEERGIIETPHRALQICGRIFKYAV